LKTNPIQIGESCLQWSFGDALDEPAIHRTLAAFNALRRSPRLAALGVVDLVPAYHTLALHFQGSEAQGPQIASEAGSLLSKLPESPIAPKGALHILRVDYCGADLQRVANAAGLDPLEVVRRHTAPEYLVAMIGFQPHFPYLFGLDPMLQTPRLDRPRLHVPAGSVAIGGSQTGVYPAESPGGWNLIGQTDPGPLRRIMPGDRIRFADKERSI
jgi:KipI family sensor histidine kinase inhibitor